MYQTTACNPRGSFAPCNLHGAPNREILPIAKPVGARKIFLDADFTFGLPITEYDLSYGSDGTVVIAPESVGPGILLTSYPYVATSRTQQDHYKYQALYDTKFDVTEGNETWVESTMAGQQLFPSTLAVGADPCGIAPALYPAPYVGFVRDPLEDFRLCASGLTAIDEVSWMQYQLLFTNRRIWATYGRLPFGKGSGTDYFAFVHAVPVWERSGSDPIVEPARLQIAIGSRTVRYFVDGLERFSVPRVGLLLRDQERVLSQPADDGGYAVPVTVSSVAVGFGTYSMVDASLPDNYSRNLQGGAYAPPGLAQLEVDPNFYSPDYVDPLTGLFVLGARTFVQSGAASCDRVWGQGSELVVQNLLVYQQQSLAA